MDNIKGWTSLPSQNCSQGPPAEKTGRGSLLNRPSCPPDDPIGQGTDLNRTGHGILFNAGKDLSARFSHEGESGIDKFAQVLTRKN